MKNLKRLHSQEALHKSQIDKLELDLQRHKDMLWEVLISERRWKNEDPIAAVPAVAAIPPTQCDSQQPQENVTVSVGEVGQAGAGVLHHGSGEENCEEEMLLNSSESDDVLDANDRGDGIWERRRSGVILNWRLVENKDNSKVKQSKTVIFEDGNESPHPGPLPAGTLLVCLRVRLPNG